MRTAVVTGAGTGIGAAITERLSADGWQVFGCGRRAEPLAKIAARCDGRMTPVICDVTDYEQVENLAAQVTGHSQALDVLIHNAGFGQCQDIDALGVDEWTQCLAVAATGAFFTAKALLPLLRTAGKHGAAHIIQIASLAAGGAWNKEIGYGTAKGAQLKFHLHLDNQLRAESENSDCQMYAHAICPGSVFTPFWDRIPERPQDPNDCLQPGEVAWLVQQVIEHPAWTAEEHARHAPRPEVCIAPHAPWQHEQSVMEIKHDAHP